MSIDNIDAYMAEARALGGWFPPKRVGALARRAYDAAAALGAAKTVRSLEKRINDEMKQTK